MFSNPNQVPGGEEIPPGIRLKACPFLPGGLPPSSGI